MIWTSYRPLVALSLAGAVLAYLGCSSRTGPSDRAARTVPAPAAPTPGSTSSKVFADWPEPAGALLISGELDNYLEPCGCTSGQLGGLRRRSDLIERIREQQWPLVSIDLGGLVKNPAGARGGFEQAKIKFTVALKALTLMKYDAVALGAEDLKVGVDEALAQFLNLGEKPKVVVANVTPAQAFATTIRPSVRSAAGPIQLGITAVLDPDSFQALNDQEKDALLTIQPPETALPAVLADLEKDTNVQVLMVQGTPELARKLAEAFPGFDIVVSTSEFADPLKEDAEVLNQGKTLLIEVGRKGKYVGVVGLFQDPKQKFRYRRVALTSRYSGLDEPMRTLVDEEFPSMLKAAGVVENFPRHDYVTGAPGATFVGAETCRSCHPNTFAKWATTKHFQAFQDLVKDPKRIRADDAECISCHTTGLEYNSGWKSPELTAHLKGNQCENCHGPASKHVADPDNLAFRKPMALTAELADKTRLCIRCHDEDNSPHFDFVTYYGKIVHKKLDSYNDPKVHQGLTPKVARRDAK
jgi:hypothetical protein